MSHGPEIVIKVDGRPLRAERHRPLVDVLREAGVEVPTLCHHAGVTAAGACRLCLVEIVREGRPSRLTTSCNLPVLEGLEVRTDTAWVRRSRQEVLSLLLDMAPGSPELNTLAQAYGVRPEGPVIRDGERCILCGLCVRVCSEIVGAEALGWAGRGDGRRVATPFDDWPKECIGCGACAAVCPTGAIRMEVEAVARFIERAGPDRPCRYAMLGLSPSAVCPSSYQCWRCEVDQRMREALQVHPAFLAAGVDIDAVKEYRLRREAERRP